MIGNVVVVGLVLVICILLDIVFFTLTKIWPRYYPSEVKQSRWESGNMPIRLPKYTLPMPYFGFMFMFMAAEPILVIILLFSAYPTVYFYAVLLLSLLLLLPTIYVGYKVSVEESILKLKK
uniref:NADH-quinone oxidoreductase subunit A n=1 Tax=Candidatus Methanophagaceae archaeon ANME-1 ERB6 TaxID=2759912 RepID=A0A7G9YZB4_9EURY|nr:hypothetical protein KFLEFLPM_00001 [Methanosarcinales archaeon ANME-1 ERB6]